MVFSKGNRMIQTCLLSLNALTEFSTLSGKAVDNGHTHTFKFNFDF